MKAARWSDNDRYWGPFTWAYSAKYRNWGVVLKADVNEDSDCGTSSLRLNAGGCTLILTLPQILKPHVRRVVPGWDQATVARLGRNYYDLPTERAFGFSYSDGFLQVFRGLRTHDSSTDRSRGYFLPWTQWRHVRHSFYGLQGEHLYDEPQTVTRLDSDWEARRAREDAVPTATYSFKDFDEEALTAATKIEEREWRFGTGYFKWLSIFRKPKISRSLDIRFSGEVGPEKGSWKGGTIGTGIDMLPGELHEAAFRRYCDEDHRSKHRKYRVTFLSRRDPLTPCQQQAGE